MRQRLQRKLKVILLLKKKIKAIDDIQFIYNIKPGIFHKEEMWNNHYEIFGKDIDLSNVKWHKDYISEFEYPIKRFDKIDISKWFDKGIDIKFPWELSRFYFAILFAQNYIISQDIKYYNLFKDLVLNWIKNNPFLYGINWICTMEVAIRAVNWIVSINIFGNILKNDIEFRKTLYKSLVQHAEYICSFPEVRKGGHTNNHATADFSGLLFLALSLKNHPKYDKWIKVAIDGLLKCMDYQVHDDGVDFEGSIPYHRLVLEMFAFSSIICKNNNVELPEWFYTKLFKMFEYTAAYIDSSGNAPQVGDNDSGRFIILHNTNEFNHSYLLDLGENIFDYTFKSQCKKKNHGFKQWLPYSKSNIIRDLDVQYRISDKSDMYLCGGAYLLKNDMYSVFISNFPIGKKDKGVHQHNDWGSFNISYYGKEIIVDPGSYTYTRDFGIRNLYRSLVSHNIVIPSDFAYKISEKWDFKKEYDFDIIKHSEFENIGVFTFKNRMIKREIILKKNEIIFNNKEVNFDDHLSLFHINPLLNILCEENRIRISEMLIIDGAWQSYEIKEYEYSNHYGSSQKGSFLIFKDLQFLKISNEE